MTQTQSTPVPVTPDRYAGWLWHGAAGYRHAAGLAQTPVVMGELAQVTTMLPVVFDVRGGAPVPVVLLRLADDGPCPLVDPATGRWGAPYAPAMLRSHPFSARLQADGRFALMVDAGSGLLVDPATATAEQRRGARALFNADHTPAPALQELLSFLRAREDSARQAREAAQLLEAEGVLIPLRPTGYLGAARCEGLAQVDPERLGALADAAVLRLFRGGALTLAQAHLLSLANCARRLRMAGGDAPPAQAGDQGGVGGFLDALALAEDDAAHYELPSGGREA